MSATGYARRGPLRRVVAVDALGGEHLTCGHVYPSPRVRVSQRPPRRRCPLCPPVPRESYFRDRYEHRTEEPNQ